MLFVLNVHATQLRNLAHTLLRARPQFNFPPTKTSLREKFPPPSRLDVGRPGLSDAGFDLLSRLLALDPARRIKAEDALAHAWRGPAPTCLSLPYADGFQGFLCHS